MSPFGRFPIWCGCWEGFLHSVRCLQSGSGRWFSVQQHNSYQPLIAIVPIKCIQTNDSKPTTRDKHTASAVREAQNNTNTTNCHHHSSPLLWSVAACCVALFQCLHRGVWLTVSRSIGEAATADLRVLACRKLWQTETLSPAHSDMLAVLLHWVVVVDLRLPGCCEGSPHLWLLVREAKLCKLWGYHSCWQAVVC